MLDGTRNSRALCSYAETPDTAVMTIGGSLSGHIAQHGAPDWQPLLGTVGSSLASWFMWMSEVELSDGTRLHAYKHVATRRYLHLAADGRAFECRLENRYWEVAAPTAVVRAFVGWERAAPPEGDVAALRWAVQRIRAA